MVHNDKDYRQKPKAVMSKFFSWRTAVADVKITLTTRYSN
jgi:hypothetical protein